MMFLPSFGSVGSSSSLQFLCQLFPARLNFRHLGLGHLPHIRIGVAEHFPVAFDVVAGFFVAFKFFNDLRQVGMLAGEGAKLFLIGGGGGGGEEPFDFPKPIYDFFQLVKHRFLIQFAGANLVFAQGGHKDRPYVNS